MQSLQKKFLPIFLQTPAVEAIGNCAEEIYWGLLLARRQRRRVLFVFLQDWFGPFVFSKMGLGVNQALIRIESRYRVKALGWRGFYADQTLGFLMTLLYSLIRLFGLVAKRFLEAKTVLQSAPSNRNHRSWVDQWAGISPRLGRARVWALAEKRPSISNSRSFWQYEVNEPLGVRLPQGFDQDGRKVAIALGLPQDDAFVCLHVRETGYYGSKEGRGKVTRNGSIKNYLDAIEYLTKRGMWVVRLGDSSMTPLPKMPDVLDYPFSEFKSDLMDIWLIQNCSLYIGQDSGPMNVALLFEKPILSTNIVDVCCGSPLRVNDRGIFKHAFSSKRNRYLSVKEILDESLLKHNGFIGDPDISFEENSSEEILELVKEYFDDMDSGKEQKNRTELQERANLQRENFDQTVAWLGAMSKDEADRFIAAVCASSGKLSDRFLNKYYFHGKPLENTDGEN